MEDHHIQLKLALSTTSFTHSTNRKRSFDHTFSDVTAPKRTLPLFEWAEKEDVLVGWPPVKSRRECTAANYFTVENGGGGGGGFSTMFVKVEMEGIGIARKLDLSIHHSYQSLLPTLLPMFGKCQENVEMYKLTYQDKEGDWLLAGDVPWGAFIESVRRLKLLRDES